MDKTRSKFKHSPSLFTRIFTKSKLELPDGWASYNCVENERRSVLLSQLTIFNNQPIMLRQIILHEDLTLAYFVGKHKVHINGVYLPSAIKMEADIMSAVSTFSTIGVCYGTAGNHGREELFYDSEMHTWRHKECTYWLAKSESDHCSSCLGICLSPSNRNHSAHATTTYLAIP